MDMQLQNKISYQLYHEMKQHASWHNAAVLTFTFA